MTESGTHSAELTWSVPQCPFTIECSTRVLDDIRLAVTDAFFSLPRGGAEIGGILLGAFANGRLIITDYAALECEHATGPSFVLSPSDEVRLERLLSASGAGGVRPVGWYHSHTRSEIFLSEADLEIHRRFFPEPWHVAMVMKPHTFQPARIGFFFREKDGSVHAEGSYCEQVLEPLPMRQVPAGGPSPPAVDDLSPRGFPPDPARTLDSVTPPDPLPAPPPPAAPPDLGVSTPKFLVESAASTGRWLRVGIGAVAIAGILIAAFQVRQMWLPQVLAAMRPDPAAPPPPPPLGLSAFDREGQLQINWDRTSPSVRRATDAILEVTGSGQLPQAMQLDLPHLQAGSFTYARTTEKVDVLLIIHQKDGPDLREVTSFLGKLPDHPPAAIPDTRKQDEMATEAKKLKADLDSQAEKTRKLEEEVKSMREELSRQQQRRLANQNAGK